MKTKQHGLSLIEVLIASLILIMSLGLVAVIFQQNFDTQRRAKVYLIDAQEFTSVLAQVRFELELGTDRGEITSGSTHYTWQSEVLQSGKEIDSINPESTLPQGGIGILTLFKVTVNNTRTANEYSFKQAIWLNNAG